MILDLEICWEADVWEAVISRELPWVIFYCPNTFTQLYPFIYKGDTWFKNGFYRIYDYDFVISRELPWVVIYCPITFTQLYPFIYKGDTWFKNGFNRTYDCDFVLCKDKWGWDFLILGDGGTVCNLCYN